MMRATLQLMVEQLEESKSVVTVQISDVFFWIQRHPKARGMVVHLDRLASCLGATHSPSYQLLTVNS
jgi:hypothetical protein